MTGHERQLVARLVGMAVQLDEDLGGQFDTCDADVWARRAKIDAQLLEVLRPLGITYRPRTPR